MIENIESAIKNNQKWHFHYLPPECNLVEGSSHRIVVEIDGESAQVYSFEQKPMPELEEIEAHFYGRK
jgi:hypothetical protein